MNKKQLKAKATQSEREANDKQWFKDFVDNYSIKSQEGLFSFSEGNWSSDYNRMKVNYDLYNNILNKEDFMYVIKPFGQSRDISDLPADLNNKDIISSKIKALLSMERDRPFDWHVIAVNPEASSRRDAKKKELLIDMVIANIMKPIEDAINAEVEAKMQALEAQQQETLAQQQQQVQQEDDEILRQIQNQNEQVGQDVQQDVENTEEAATEEEQQIEEESPQEEQEQVQREQQEEISQEEQQQAQDEGQGLLDEQQMQEVEAQKQQILEEAQARIEQSKPQELDRYIQRKFRDPAEILCHQLLQYIIRSQDILEKFNLGFKNGLISGRTIFWCGILNEQPVLEVINPLGFSFDRSNHLSRIEDGEWASYERYMTPTQIVEFFADELQDEDIDKIYEAYNSSHTYFSDNNRDGVRVLHCEWKGLKKIKFVSGVDPETNEEYYVMVDERYKINKDVGDKEVHTSWIPTKFEGYKIADDIYCYLREVPGQHKDINNIYECKLSYIGNSYDATNSKTTSLVDRMKHFQYLYNIIWYRIEMLTAKDDTKKLLIGSNLIPSSSELNVIEWMHFLKNSNIGVVNMKEEGNQGMPINIGSYISQIDMSMSNDINRYIQLAQYIEQMCGEAAGITKQDIATNDQVKLQTNRAFNNSVLDAYFNTHRDIKKRVLQSLVEVMKVAYSTFQPESLSYFLDDVSIAQLNPDYELFDNNTYGIFISDSPKIDDKIQNIQMLAQASLQAQKIELSDFLAIMGSTNLEEAKEILQVSEERKRKEQEAQMQQQQQTVQQQQQFQQQMQREQNEFKMQFMIKQEELKKEREILKQTILSTGFNEDKDLDKDGVPDVIELYKAGKDIDVKEKKLKLAERGLDLKEKALEQRQEEVELKRSMQKNVLKKHVK